MKQSRGKRLLSYMACFSTVCVSALSGLAVTNAEKVYAATTLADMPSEYEYAADWIWNNRVVAENSTGSSPARYNVLFDQIIDGKGTLNFVVRWHSTSTITLEQRQKLEVAAENNVNAWTDCLVGFEDWPYDHVDVSIVGWAVTDKSLLLDLQDDEVVYTDTETYTIVEGESSEIPTVMASAPSELSRFDHFMDENYEYPGGLDKRFDMYLWATQGFPDYGACGGDWGQRLSDNAYKNMADTGTSFVHIHELGHGFGMTDFYGAEGASDGFPPGGIPGGGSIMMAGAASAITDFDTWFIRYMWSHLKDEAGRFDLANAGASTGGSSNEGTQEDDNSGDANQGENNQEVVTPDNNQNNNQDSNQEGNAWGDANQEGQLPGEGQEGEIPEGQNPEGEGQEGEMPDGQAPEGEGQEGEMPDGQTPEGEASGTEGNIDDTPQTSDTAVLGGMIALFAVTGIALYKRYKNQHNYM